MPDKVVYVTDHALYDINALLKTADIKINSKETYTFTSTSGEQKSATLMFVFNGHKVTKSALTFDESIVKEITIKGGDLHRLTIIANTGYQKGVVDPSENRGRFPPEDPLDLDEDIPRVEYIPYNKISIKVQSINSGKSRSLTVATNELPKGAYEKDQPPTIKTKRTLTSGDNKIEDLVSYKDTDSQVNFIRLNVNPGASKSKEVSLIFDGMNIGNDGKFYFTPSQLSKLKLYISPEFACDDVVKVRAFDVQGKGSPTSASLTSGL